VTNIGMRPTFNGSTLSVETHLLDASPEVTPERIEVYFWKRLRNEKKFSGPEELREQIARDIATRESILLKTTNSPDTTPTRLKASRAFAVSILCGFCPVPPSNRPITAQFTLFSALAQLPQFEVE